MLELIILICIVVLLAGAVLAAWREIKHLRAEDEENGRYMEHLRKENNKLLNLLGSERDERKRLLTQINTTPMTPAKAKVIAEECFRHPKVVDKRRMFRTKQEWTKANRDGDDAA